MKLREMLLEMVFSIKNLAQNSFVHYKQLSKITAIKVLRKLAVILKFFYGPSQGPWQGKILLVYNGFNHSLGCAYPTLYISRLLGRVYHFSWLICYPCLFYFHALCWFLFGSGNSLHLMTLGKTRNLPQILIRS